VNTNLNRHAQLGRRARFLVIATVHHTERPFADGPENGEQRALERPVLYYANDSAPVKLYTRDGHGEIISRRAERSEQKGPLCRTGIVRTRRD